MIFKVLILISIALVGIYSIYRQYEKKNYKGIIIWVIVGMITLGIVTNYFTDILRPFLPYPDTSTTSSVPTDDNKEPNSIPDQANTRDERSDEGDNETDGTDNTDNTNNTETISPLDASKLTQMHDISDARSVNGRLGLV